MSGRRRGTHPPAAHAGPQTSSAGHPHLKHTEKWWEAGQQCWEPPSQPGVGRAVRGPTFSVQFSQWPDEAFLLVGYGRCPGAILLLLQQVLLCPALGVVLPQGRDL